MKKTMFKLGFAAIIAVSVMVSSCGKYEDGPKISLATKKSRMGNEWKLTSAYKNGVGYSFSGTADVIDVKKDGIYIQTYSSLFGSFSYTGTWSFSSDKESVTFTPNGSSSSTTFTILRLKGKELWLEKIDGTDKYEYHYDQN